MVFCATAVQKLEFFNYFLTISSIRAYTLSDGKMMDVSYSISWTRDMGNIYMSRERWVKEKKRLCECDGMNQAECRDIELSRA